MSTVSLVLACFLLFVPLGVVLGDLTSSLPQPPAPAEATPSAEPGSSLLWDETWAVNSASSDSAASFPPHRRPSSGMAFESSPLAPRRTLSPAGGRTSLHPESLRA